jgi:hypothetical protein
MYFKVRLNNGLDIYHESQDGFDDILQSVTSINPHNGTEWNYLRDIVFNILVGYRVSDIDYVREVEEHEVINLKDINSKDEVKPKKTFMQRLEELKKQKENE